MMAAIQTFADGIAPTPVDTDLVTSKALRMTEGIVASGGSRHESDQFALWEFKEGAGLIAYDSSDVGHRKST